MTALQRMLQTQTVSVIPALAGSTYSSLLVLWLQHQWK